MLCTTVGLLVVQQFFFRSVVFLCSVLPNWRNKDIHYMQNEWQPKDEIVVFGITDGNNKTGRPHREWANDTVDWCIVSLHELSYSKRQRCRSTPLERRLSAHLPFLGHSAHTWIPMYLWCTASVMPDLWLPFQPHSITALWPVPNYTAWWHRHMCVNNLPRIVRWSVCRLVLDILYILVELIADFCRSQNSNKNSQKNNNRKFNFDIFNTVFTG